MRYKLSTEALNFKNMKVITNGIIIPDNNIPILLGHNSEKVLGKWTNFTKENNELYAEPIWDEADADTQKTIDKIKNGFIDGISIGLKMTKAQIPDNSDEIIVTEGILLEASITPLPANTEARIDNEVNVKDIKVAFSLKYEDETDINKIKEKLLASVNHNNVNKQIAEKVKDAKNAEKAENSKVELKDTKVEKKEDKTKEKPTAKVTKKVVKNALDIDHDVDPDTIGEVDPAIDGFDVEHKEDLITLPDRLIKMFSIDVKDTDNKYSKIILELGKMNTERDEKIVKLEANINELNALKDTKEAKIVELEAKLNKDSIETYLKEAKKAGKINDTQFAKFSVIAEKGMFDEVKEIIENTTITLSNDNKLTAQIDNKKADVKDFEWYQKNDSQYLLNLKKNDLESYNALLNAYLKK